jgi:hypothetical protein
MNVIKEAINKSNFIQFQDIINSKIFSWYFLEDSAFLGEFKNSNTYSFNHLIFKDSKIYSNYYDVVNSIALQLKDKFKLENYKIIRLRIGLTTSYGKKIINKPHIDSQYKHKVILFYLNNSDGDTYFYKNNKIIDSITPEENKAVLFDGEIYHSSSKPFKNSKRIVLNINLENESK